MGGARCLLLLLVHGRGRQERVEILLELAPWRYQGLIGPEEFRDVLVGRRHGIEVHRDDAVVGDGRELGNGVGPVAQFPDLMVVDAEAGAQVADLHAVGLDEVEVVDAEISGSDKHFDCHFLDRRDVDLDGEHGGANQGDDEITTRLQTDLLHETSPSSATCFIRPLFW